MVKKSSRPSSPPELANAIQALREATQALARSTSGDPPAADPTPSADPARPDAAASAAEENPQGDGPRRSPPVEHDPEARAFYERLEQAGQMADVTDDTDLSKLPPRITHIRRSDGTIERIGFS